MSPHLKYASYVARHKWFVFRAGLRTKAPLWRLFIHDWSKLTPAEWFPYVQTFYGEPLDPSIGRGLGDDGVRLAANAKAVRQSAFDKAWLHHQHRNPHHWQHWLLREDDGETKALRMPTGLVKEMVADWMGAGRAITGKWGCAAWYADNEHKIVLHPETRAMVKYLVEIDRIEHRYGQAA